MKVLLRYLRRETLGFGQSSHAARLNLRASLRDPRKTPGLTVLRLWVYMGCIHSSQEFEVFRHEAHLYAFRNCCGAGFFFCKDPGD